MLIFVLLHRRGRRQVALVAFERARVGVDHRRVELVVGAQVRVPQEVAAAVPGRVHDRGPRGQGGNLEMEREKEGAGRIETRKYEVTQRLCKHKIGTEATIEEIRTR